ncbi:hypothetical protein [Microcoleus vaginatus]|uniref:hypothetical protein n=1 Tax=Microcoleus vaginatus TaxID=119532 RepID=UPI00403F14A0
MRGRWLFAAIFACVVTAFTIAPLTPNSALARTELPITEIRWFNYSPEDSWQPIQFIVPDRNTAKSAGSRKLRLYDVHIAKMFEISHFLCDRDRASEGYNWSYQAENGSIEMGRFKISCNLARFHSHSLRVRETRNYSDSPQLQPEKRPPFYCGRKIFDSHSQHC